MNSETFSQLLNRLAIEHLDRQTKYYIQQLENVAQVATSVVKNRANLDELKKALEKLNEAA